MQIIAGNPRPRVAKREVVHFRNLFCYDGIFPYTNVTRSMKISTRAQFYTLDPFDYKQKSKDNRKVPEFMGTQIAMCALERPSRVTYKRW